MTKREWKIINAIPISVVVKICKDLAHPIQPVHSFNSFKVWVINRAAANEAAGRWYRV